VKPSKGFGREDFLERIDRAGQLDHSLGNII